jgi:Lysyl oxidase
VSAALVLALGFGVPAEADPLDPHLGDPGRTLPNLSPDVQTVQILRPFLFDEATQTVYEGPPELYFDSWAQNLGTVPLQLAFGGIENPETAVAEQCVSWRSAEAYVCREQVPIGGFSWHQEHTHFHYNEFAGYQLRKLLRNGKVDYSADGLIAASDKVSFCLIDSTRIREDASPTGFYSTCTPTVEGISPGWADIYDSSLEGQQLPLDGVTDGRYALVVNLDYADRIHETDNGDNVVEATLEISGGVTNVSIVGRNYP